MTIEANWRTSSYTGTENCIEVADNDPAVVLIRDTKQRDGGQLDLPPVAWAHFVVFAKQLPL